MNLNRAILIGRLTRDPETRTTTSGQTVAHFGLATNRVWNNQEGQRQESTEFHNVVAWARLAEICNQYLRKGSLVMVEGRLQTRSWQAQDGTTKYRTEVVAENIQLGPRATGEVASQPTEPLTPPSPSTSPASNSKAGEEKLETINLDEQGNPIEQGEFGNPSEAPATVMPF